MIADRSEHRHLDLGTAGDGGLHAGMTFVHRTLAAWDGPSTAGEREDILLVACELMTNAYAHSPGATAVDLDRAAGRVTVAVTDSGGPRRPTVRPWRPQEPHGHGLHIVDRLATTWGVTPATGGKTVWARLPWSPGPR